MNECPVEAVFGPDDRVPCLLERGHDGPHQYTSEAAAKELTALRRQILDYLATHPRATTREISQALGRGPHMDELDYMAADGLLTPCNVGGYIGWEIR